MVGLVPFVFECMKGGEEGVGPQSADVALRVGIPLLSPHV